jgi:hypothetical protein
MPNFQPTANSQQHNRLNHSAVLILTCSLLFILFSFSANAQSLTLQLAPSLYGGDFNISCFGSSDGSIDLTVTGGTPPYTYHWSNNANTQDIGNLAAGYYAVNVSDANNNFATTQITLIQPPALEVFINVFTYPNKFNISCFDCYNGMISTEVDGGVYPYEYVWPDDDAITTPDRLGLGSGTYQVLVIDLNGCRAESYSGYLTAPERSDWTMGGNEGTNPVSDYIGTSDETDLVFKTTGIEALRIKNNGQIKVQNFTGTGEGYIFADENGVLNAFRPGTPPPPHNLPWFTFGNTLATPLTQFLGTTNETDLVFKTNNIQQAVITSYGKIGIGNNNPIRKLDISLQSSPDGIRLNNNSTSEGVSELRFDYNGSQQWAIGSRFNATTGLKHFFIWNHNLSPGSSVFVIDGNGKVGIACDPPSPSSNEFKLYVEGGIMTREVKVTLNVFADDVFEPDYQLPSLAELGSFIKANRHLPGIPSACEVEENDGFELGDMQVRLLRKTEELTLYILQQQKLIDELRNRIQVLEDQN